jgi:6-phosphogluconate dehydrogenase
MRAQNGVNIYEKKGLAMSADIGLIGLAVMGQNLALNIADHGFGIAVFNRTTSKVDDFLQGPAKGKKVVGTHSLAEFFRALKRPRRAIFMVKAGSAVDELIRESMPFLEKGDILIDGGNSNFEDTRGRTEKLREKGILFLGVGISGGEEGARYGASIMPGGEESAWKEVQLIFRAIAAKAPGGEPCCDWIGKDGAGHFVKMVHNGIEYGDMQLISEAYDLLHRLLYLDHEKIGAIFDAWNEGPLNSYLIEITAAIMRKKDLDGTPLLDKILDAAGQKGTGKWAVGSALDLNVPLDLISEAVFARNLSNMTEARKAAQKAFPGDPVRYECDQIRFIRYIENALFASKISSYTQGFLLLEEASRHYGWNLDLGKIALLWRGGCIIRSQFLDKIKEAYSAHAKTPLLFATPYFQEELTTRDEGWRTTVSKAAEFGVPIPAMAAALSFYDGIRTKRLPACLIQAQRDFFGAHTYEKVDRPRGEFFHTEWSE